MLGTLKAFSHLVLVTVMVLAFCGWDSKRWSNLTNVSRPEYEVCCLLTFFCGPCSHHWTACPQDTQAWEEQLCGEGRDHFLPSLIFRAPSKYGCWVSHRKCCQDFHFYPFRSNLLHCFHISEGSLITNTLVLITYQDVFCFFVFFSGKAVSIFKS